MVENTWFSDDVEDDLTSNQAALNKDIDSGLKYYKERASDIYRVLDAVKGRFENSGDVDSAIETLVDLSNKVVEESNNLKNPKQPKEKMRV